MRDNSTREQLAEDRDRALAALEATQVELERLREFAFGDAPEWETANASLKHRVRELQAEVEHLREVVASLLPFATYPADCTCDKTERCECNYEDAQARYWPAIEAAQEVVR